MDNRIELQKAVYLLENMGVDVGDYSFSWNKYGPYSLGLDSDAQNCSMKDEQEVCFSSTAEHGFEKLREYINEQIKYSRTQWMECIAALHFLKNIYRIKESQLKKKKKKRKPYLSNKEANEKALSIAKEIKVGV